MRTEAEAQAMEKAREVLQDQGHAGSGEVILKRIADPFRAVEEFLAPLSAAQAARATIPGEWTIHEVGRSPRRDLRARARRAAVPARGGPQDPRRRAARFQDRREGAARDGRQRAGRAGQGDAARVGRGPRLEVVRDRQLAFARPDHLNQARKSWPPAQA